MDLFISKYLLGNMKLELSVLMLCRTVEGGYLHWLFPNVNSETAKYTSPRMLGSVYLAVSSLTFGWNCTQCTLQSSSPQPWLCLGCALALENLTAKCTLFSFNSSPSKSIFKSASSRCAQLGWLGKDLAGLEPESVKSPSLHSATWPIVCDNIIFLLFDIYASFFLALNFT